jgi:putative redox protein
MHEPNGSGANMIQGRRDDSQKDGLVAILNAPTHQFLVDVSPKLGGTDQAPNPHELLEAALVGCTIITLQMYANRHGWPLQSADVKVTIVSEGATTQLAREVTLRGDLSDQQRSKLMEIADKCPIHRLLLSDINGMNF